MEAAGDQAHIMVSGEIQALAQDGPQPAAIATVLQPQDRRSKSESFEELSPVVALVHGLVEVPQDVGLLRLYCQRWRQH